MKQSAASNKIQQNKSNHYTENDRVTLKINSKEGQ